MAWHGMAWHGVCDDGSLNRNLVRVMRGPTWIKSRQAQVKCYYTRADARHVTFVHVRVSKLIVVMAAAEHKADQPAQGLVSPLSTQTDRCWESEWEVRYLNSRGRVRV
jgi:hypothetical protein